MGFDSSKAAQNYRDVRTSDDCGAPMGSLYNIKETSLQRAEIAESGRVKGMLKL